MNTLYPELISSIFDEVCEDYRKSIRESMMYRDDYEMHPCNPMHFGVKRLTTPINITQVCRSWKEIADSTQELWDTIHLKPYWMDDTDITKEEHLQCYLDASKYLERWLDRAGVAPLTIKIHKRFCMGKESLPAGDGSIMRQILAHYKQWRRLDIYCPSAEDTSFAKLQEVLYEPLPLLKTFVLHPADSFFPHPITRVNAPNISATTLFSTIDLFIPPTTSLTTVNFEQALNYDDIMDYFYHCEKLESYSIALANDNTDSHIIDIIPRPPVEVRLLRELVISTKSSVDVNAPTIFSDILESIFTPLLQKLYLDFDYLSGQLLAFLERSSFPPLTTLSIYSHYTDEVFGDALLDVLRVVPKLSHLEFFNMKFIPSTTEDHPSIVLNCVTSLRIIPESIRGQENLALYILKNVSLPKLQDLDISLSDICTKPNYEDQQRLGIRPTLIDIPNIYSNLRNLTIHISNMSLLDGFITFVKRLYNVECLHVLVPPFEVSAPSYNERDSILSSFGAAFMNMVLPSVSDTPLDNTSDESYIVHLPKLKDLSYEGTFSTAASQETLISALEFRWNDAGDNKVERLKSARIFRVQLRIYKPFRAATEDISSRIEQLRFQGMDLLFA